MSSGESRGAVAAALAANIGIAIAKAIGFIVTGSGSMLAEAGHSLADSGNQALLLFGARRAVRGADAEHPFGHSREHYFSAFLVAVILFTAGAGFALREGIDKIVHPHQLESTIVAIVILVVSIGLESFSLRTAVAAANRSRGARGWWTFVRESKNADLAVVLLEDTAALVGLALALAGVGLAAATHDPVWDAIGTIGIAGLLGVVAVVMAIETKSLLIGESASKEEIETIRRVIDSAEGLAGLVHLRTEQRGPDELLVAAKVAVSPRSRSGDLAKLIDDVEARIREAVPAARYIFIEPDVRRDA
jgi:cation diffusion facilitator family transporter